MPKILVCGRGGSGKSTLASMLAGFLAERGPVLVLDADESNLGLPAMLGLDGPEKTIMDSLGGKVAVRERLLAALRGEGGEAPAFFEEPVDPRRLPPECVSTGGGISMVRIGKIDHSMEGCACPMGALARAFLKSLRVKPEEWVLVDTEAGIEHFGRGVLEGADAVLLVVDPSREAVLLAEKAARLCREAGKPFFLVVNRSDREAEGILRDMLSEVGLHPSASLPFSPEISRACLEGSPLAKAGYDGSLEKLVAEMEKSLVS